jgi:hypothetical protein
MKTSVWHTTHYYPKFIELVASVKSEKAYEDATLRSLSLSLSVSVFVGPCPTNPLEFRNGIKRKAHCLRQLMDSAGEVGWTGFPA